MELTLDKDFLLHGPIKVGPTVIPFEHGYCNRDDAVEYLFHGAPYRQLHGERFIEVVRNKQSNGD